MTLQAIKPATLASFEFDKPFAPPEPALIPGLEFAFEMKLVFAGRYKTGVLPAGFTRGFTPPAGGTIRGPKLQGTVVANSGGDWPAFWPSGAVEFTAQYLLEATDGTLIVIKNRGFRYATPAVTERMEALAPVHASEYYMRLSPFFEAPVGPHDWMNRTVFVGSAERFPEHSIFRFWQVT